MSSHLGHQESADGIEGAVAGPHGAHAARHRPGGVPTGPRPGPRRPGLRGDGRGTVGNGARHSTKKPGVPRANIATTTAAAAASIRLRPAHRQSRPATPTGRATIGRFSRKRRRSSASARASAYRCDGVLLQAFQADRLQVARHVRAQPRRRHGLGRGDQLERLQRRIAQERRPAGQRLVEDRPQRIDVGGRAHRPANAPRPAPVPCSWASPSPGRSRSAPSRRPAAWPARSRPPSARPRPSTARCSA